MVIYNSHNKLSSGVPLGGIGAGKIELDNKVRMINASILNNWNNPIRLLRGFHVFIKPGERYQGFLFQKNSGLSTIREYQGEIVYEGRYPFVRILGRIDNISIKLEAFSPIIPHDLKNSTLPIIGIAIKITGSKSGIIALSMPNIIGTTSIGRINERINSSTVIHKNLKANEYDPAKGDATLTTNKVKHIVIQYNLKKKPSENLNYWSNQYENEEPWQNLNEDKMPLDDIHEVRGHRDEPSSIIISEYEENEEVRFAYSWYITGKHVFYPYGHYYHNFFKNSYEIAKYFMENYEELKRKSEEWHKNLSSYLPDWLKDAIINSAYILSTSTWLDEKGRFAIYEAPENCPYLGTIGTCYEFGSLPVLLMFPELEKSFLKTLASQIREDGYVPHDLGYNSLDSPIDGTTSPPRWKDMNPTFILLVYRYFKFTNDLEFLKEIYPSLVKAMEWEFSVCKDGLPYLEGEMDNAFDATIIKGHDSYTSSLYIASLIAMKQIAKLMKDNKTLSNVDEKLKMAREAYRKMFNGKYFKSSDNLDGCFIAQIFGEWWTTLLGLEQIIEDEKIVSALNYILNLNGNASKYCTPNLVSDKGEIVNYSQQTYSSWPRMVFAISWLGYKKGITGFLKLAEKEWQNLVENGLTWDQPSKINARNGKPEPIVNYLDHYIGSPSIWSFLF